MFPHRLSTAGRVGSEAIHSVSAATLAVPLPVDKRWLCRGQIYGIDRQAVRPSDSKHSQYRAGLTLSPRNARPYQRRISLLQQRKRRLSTARAVLIIYIIYLLNTLYINHKY